MAETQKAKTTTAHKALTVVGIVLCVLLIPALIINCTLIVKSWINPDAVPSVGGYYPMIVLTESMEPEIMAGDLIICKNIDADRIKVGDTITFYDPDGNGTTTKTHEVVKIEQVDGKLQFTTKGVNNNTEDKKPVLEDKVLGIYQSRIPVAGRVALFMQTPVGLIVCVGVPLVLLLGWDFLRRRKADKAKQADADALLAELEALKAEKAAKEAAAEEKAPV